ncbi:hypothetical protein UFOVP833_28 [uncultured Caudovirales phage]|uniref:Uncharacterized protein n=1 Tax=uncultured Caudovirales phage TaxID=2100421 RepID=A0A6J5P7E9_9CAUD|nr:hypothetical protein UFOVP833_28 [uncultured Caudovirales phage]CAB4218867.1 hypothetical protein UFOVP1603_59 [uncultured Caudovirales phage]
MPRTTHRMKALCPFALDAIEVEITYTFTPGAPEQGPSYSSGGQPADPDEVELIRVETEVNLLPDLQKMLIDWAIEHLASDDGFAVAVDQAEEDEDAARERAAEMRDEMRRER